MEDGVGEGGGATTEFHTFRASEADRRMHPLHMARSIRPIILIRTRIFVLLTTPAGVRPFLQKGGPPLLQLVQPAFPHQGAEVCDEAHRKGGRTVAMRKRRKTVPVEVPEGATEEPKRTQEPPPSK